MHEVEGQIAAASSGAMRDTMPDAKQELRDQVVGAGLGGRLANTWRGDVYPKSAKSMHPAGYIHSNAPLIIDSFLRGAQIVPIAGGKYLAIPTASVPLSRRGSAIGAGRKARGAGSRMSPVEVEAVFGQDLIIKPGRNGHLLAFVDPDQSRGRRLRRPKGQKGKLVLMFTLVKSVRMPRLLDLDGPGQRWASAFGTALQRRLGSS
ncbi:DUF6441 family protein [Sphingomonas bacterium]|uniref:DUF6441 family protein n=1 Tax=Sphingomonas bacterium TaxID=1895847 RepID=UPI00266FF512|nr:DUF6441 family protein [Sphingomonas bacterium]